MSDQSTSDNGIDPGAANRGARAPEQISGAVTGSGSGAGGGGAPEDYDEDAVGGGGKFAMRPMREAPAEGGDAPTHNSR